MSAVRKIRVGAVNYLNTKPLVHGLESLAPWVRLSYDLPSRLADSLASGKLDVALIPSIRSHDEKPPLATSVPTAAFLTSFCIAFLTLGLWLAMAGVWSGAVCWWILAWQRRASW